MDLPVDCVPGETCWIVNYVDHDPTKGLRDYACGKATYNAPPGDRHKGTDFAIRDLAAMRRGVAVRAAAPGIVVGARDALADVSVRKIGAAAVKGKECGNGVRIDHGDGWATQYCHMRRGSVRARKGMRVKAGQTLGMIGLSGLTEFAHLHIQVTKGKTIVDPFVGLESNPACGLGRNPLWTSEVTAAFPYQPTALYNGGFAGSPPNAEKVRDGAYDTKTLPASAEALVLWVDMFNVRKGDVVTLIATDPNGKIVIKNSGKIPKNQARSLRYAGRKRKGTDMPTGTYRGEITLIRPATAPGGPLKIVVNRQITIQ